MKARRLVAGLIVLLICTGVVSAETEKAVSAKTENPTSYTPMSWILHPEIEYCKLVGPRVNTLIEGSEITIVFWLSSKKEDGKEPKAVIKVSGGEITEAKSDYFNSVSHSKTEATFYDCGLLEEGKAKFGVIIVKPTDPSLSISLSCEVKDKDNDYTSKKDATLSYQVIELRPDNPKVYEYLSELAESRRKVTEDSLKCTKIL